MNQAVEKLAEVVIKEHLLVKLINLVLDATGHRNNPLSHREIHGLVSAIKETTRPLPAPAETVKKEEKDSK